MAILPHNLNLMDSEGLILGSGDADPINTRHEAAQLVFANGRAVEVDANGAQALRNVKPGVNVPLMLEGQLVGVIGGRHSTKEASLIRMTAEMLLSQRFVQSQRVERQQRI